MRLRLAALLLLASVPAFTQTAQPTQVLDRVSTFSTNTVLDIKFGSTDTPVENLGLLPPPGSSLAFQTCTVTTVGGLYCLDGQKLRRWSNPHANPQLPTSSEEVLDCTRDLGLNRSETCVALAVDIKGQIWLGVRKKNSHSVYKIRRNGTNDCYTSPLCVNEPYTGRPAIVDLVAVDGDLAKVFKACPSCQAQAGVVGIEERKNAVFFPDSGGTPTTMATGSTWGLIGKELLQEITPLRLNPDSPVTGILVTTTNGRVLARPTSVAGSTFPWVNIPALRAATSDQILPKTCTGTAEPQYGVRASLITGQVYVSDRNCFQVLQFSPTGTSFSSSTSLDYVTALPTSPFGVIGLTLAPGISIDLSKCYNNTTGCTLVSGPSGEYAARLLGLQLGMNSPSGATVLQVKGIPECRLASLLTSDQKKVCASKPGVVVDLSGAPVSIDEEGTLTPSLPAAQLRLNVTPLLPDEVIDAVSASGLPLPNNELPPLLISNWYRAQQRRDFTFEAFFVIPQPGVRFVGTYGSEYQVGFLESLASDVNVCQEWNPGSLVAWDITTHVSELFGSERTTDPQNPNNYVDTLANVGCGSIRGAGASLSLLPYDLQVNPDTYAPVWTPTGTTTNRFVTTSNDAVYARLLQSLYDELRSVLVSYACTTADGGSQPISTPQCNSLVSTWQNGKIKLDKCIDAAFQPKSSASNENCQSWVSQLTNYRNALPATTPDYDLANRVGDQKARIATLFHVYSDRFLPSIPPGGFCRETGGC